MSTKKQKTLQILQILHLCAFLTGSFTIILLHTLTHNFLDFLRFPLFLRQINYLIGYKWPGSLHVYQIILIFSLVLAATDSLGLIFYKQRLWKMISDLASFLGFIIILPVVLFFIFTLTFASKLTVLNLQTIIAYFSFTLFVLILDLITWIFDEQSFIKTLKKEKKRYKIK